MTLLYEYRQVERTAKCSVCYDKILPNKNKVVSFYGKKEQVFICKKCLRKLSDLIADNYEDVIGLL